MVWTLCSNPPGFSVANFLRFLARQLEKLMARTEERGWYVSDSSWSGDSESTEGGPESSADASGLAANNEEADPDSFTFPADESRDRCVVSGKKFEMFFDDDDGIYKYKNCREIEVLNDDDVSLEESVRMLVNVTSWRGLGSPAFLTRDQTLRDVMQD